MITLALSIACMPAAASNQYNIRKYVALGDSIATGMNEEKGPPKLPTGEVGENGEPVMGKTVGSNDIGYTANVAKQLDLIEGSGYVSYAYPGLRAHDIRYMLDEAFAAENDGTVPEVGPSFDDLRGTFTEEQLKAECARCLGCGTAVVDEFMCVGCGICTTKCKFDAIHLEKIHDADNLEYFHTLGRIAGHVPALGANIVKKHIGRIGKKDA